MRLYGIQSGLRSGAYNMALDEALLEYCRAQREPLLIVRTYGWDQPTLSLGVNQAERDVAALLKLYGDINGMRPALVRRPTGGRAILHGADTSFSFASNDPALLRSSLKASYAALTGHVRRALVSLGLSVTTAREAGDRDYLRSPVCFETHTASDLIAENGQKLAGSAQLRRSGGLLQHGAAFLAPYGIPEPALAEALFAAVAEAHRQPDVPAFPMAVLDAERLRLEAAYSQESGEILERASTTSGSHLAPASC